MQLLNVRLDVFRGFYVARDGLGFRAFRCVRVTKLKGGGGVGRFAYGCCDGGVFFTVSWRPLWFEILYSGVGRGLTRGGAVECALRAERFIEGALRSGYGNFDFEFSDHLGLLAPIAVNGFEWRLCFDGSVVFETEHGFRSAGFLALRRRDDWLLEPDGGLLEGFVEVLSRGAVEAGLSLALEPLKTGIFGGRADAWMCSALVCVVSPVCRGELEARRRLQEHCSYVQGSLSTLFPCFGIVKVPWWRVWGVLKSLLLRKVYRSYAFEVSGAEIGFLLRLPRVELPSYVFSVDVEPRYLAPRLKELPRKGLLIGYCKRASRVPVFLPVEHLPLSLAIFGVPGSGKTRLVRSLVRQYLKMGGRVTILDRHGEYLNAFNANMLKVRVGVDSFKLNLLDPLSGDMEAHAKKLVDVFLMTWPDEFGSLMGYVFRETYLSYMRSIAGKKRPDLRDYVKFIEGWAHSANAVKARDKAFSLAGRLSELATGRIGNVFCGDGGEASARYVVNENVVFDLSHLDSDRDVNIFSWILLKTLLDFRRRNPSRDVPHVVVCEEAHNIVPARFEGKLTIVEQSLKEMRKFGVSMWIVDQRPLSVSRDVLGLCGNFVCFKLQYSSDAGKIAETLRLTEEQKKHLQRLERGEAVAFMAAHPEPLLIDVAFMD